MIIKIATTLTILLLFIGLASATNLSDLKVPIGYNEETEGYYYLNIDEDSHLYVGKLSDNEGAFDNDTGYMVIPIGGNLYFYCDSGMKSTGIQEKVKIDGTDYLVSFYKDNFIGSMKDTELKMFQDDIKDFNKDNKLEPIAV